MNDLQFLYLSNEDIIKAGGDDIKLFISVIEEVFKIHASGDISQPLKPYLKRKDQTHVADRIIAMPSYVGGDIDISGIKWIASAHENPKKYNLPRATGVIILNDSITGAPISILDSTKINIMRTAAVSAVAAKNLARDNSETIGLIGAGAIGKMQVKAISSVLKNINKVTLYDLDKEQSEQWKEEIQNEINLNIEVKSSVEDALENADVIVTSTTAKEGYIKSKHLKKGHLFLNVSLNDPKFDVILNSDKIVVDDWEQCNRKDKVLNRMYKDNLIDDDSIYAEIGEIVNGTKKGRESLNENIFFNPMGMSIEDIGSAAKIYENAKEKNIGKLLSLWENI